MKAREADERHMQFLAGRPLGFDMSHNRVYEEQHALLGAEGALLRLPADVTDDTDLVDPVTGTPYFMWGLTDFFDTTAKMLP